MFSPTVLMDNKTNTSVPLLFNHLRGVLGRLVLHYFVLGSLLLQFQLLLLRTNGLNVSGDEQIHQLTPLLSLLQRALQHEDLSGQQPEHSSDGFGHSVVAGDHDVDVLERSVSVAESDGGDVDVRSLNDCLTITLGVSDDQQSGFLEFLGHLVGKGAGNPSR